MPKRDPFLRKLGQTVAKCREEKGLSQERLAERADLNRTCLSHMERGAQLAG